MTVLVCLLWTSLMSGLAMAQDAPVDRNSIKIDPGPGPHELSVSFRLVRDTVPTAPAVRARAEDSDAVITAAWKPWREDEIPATAWLIIIDNSDPRRRDTIAENVKIAREFIGKLPERDAFTVHTLARELVLVKPFGTPRDEALEAVAAVRPGGSEALVTLIHQSMREGLRYLKDRPEPRKAVLLFTDGIDETAGGPDAIEAERRKLIDLALERGVAIHTLCYAERASAMTYFGPFREISRETGGVHVPAEPADRRTNARKLPEGSLGKILAAMQGAGTVVVNVSALADVVGLPPLVNVSVQTSGGRDAIIPIPSEKIAELFVEPTPTPGPVEEIGEAETPLEPIDEPVPDEIIDPEEELEEIEDASLLDQPWWVWALIGLALVVAIVAVLRIVANSRAREKAAIAAEEAARSAAEEEQRLAAMQAAGSGGRGAAGAALAWLEMCDSEQSRLPIKISNVRVGRGQHNDVVLRNDSVSGNHCVIERNRNGEWGITDLNSGNGVTVNSERIQQAPLAHGDLIELGEIKMRFLTKG